jgi:hypothetical protein
MLMEMQQISTEVFEALDDGHVGRNMYCFTDVENNLNLKDVNFKILS